MSSSYYLSRLGHRVTVFEAMEVVGGLLRTAIPPYRLPVEVVEKEVEKLKAMGVQFETRYRINSNNWKDLENFDAVLFAHGAGVSVPLAFPLADDIKQRIISGLDFLNSIKLTPSPSLPGGTDSLPRAPTGEVRDGNSHSIKPKRQVHPGDKIAVIGGGNTAIDAARVAVRLGASPTIVYRRSRAEMPAFQSEVDDALEEGVEIIFLTSPIGIESIEGSLRIQCIKNRLVESDEDGRHLPVPIEGSEFTLAADTVISAIGEISDLSFFPRDVELSARSVSVDELGSTSQPGVFACGDLTAQPRSVAHAIGSGKKAAIAVDCYLREQPRDGLLNVYKIGEKGNISFKFLLDNKATEGQQKDTPPTKPSSTHDGTSQAQEGHKKQVGVLPRREAPVPSIPSHQVARFEDLNPGYFHYQERFERVKIPVEDRKGFEEICATPTVENALGEARRCLSCGSCCLCDNCYLLCPDSSVLKHEDEAHHVIDYEYCKGCGICENECPAGFIEMERET
jgi:NADPH-dependent glutamate synthase beta subunit-like oxidoreductase/Pyruvate/2-oxoacid:ferredoxin oxidoreductase delta subunit